MDTKRIEVAAAWEMTAPTWGLSEQFLKVHQLVSVDGSPAIARVDVSREDYAIVYFQVEGEKFFFTVYVSYDSVPEICGMTTEAYHSVYVRAISEHHSGDELSSWCSLTPARIRNKGERKRPNGHRGIVHRRSVLDFEPNPEPDQFGIKLTKLLDYLDTDPEGVARLVAEAAGYIQVYTSFHNGNTMLGGHHLSTSLIQRLSSFALAIDFDISADGNFYAD